LSSVRIAYACYWNLFEKDGIAKKINGQVRHWRAAGHEAEVFCVSRAPELTAPWRLFPFRGVRGRWQATQALQRAVVDYDPDVVYLRFDLYLPPMGLILRRFPTVIEVQTKDREEISRRAVRPRSATAYLELNRHLVASRSAGIVGVTHEIAALPRFTRYGKPTLVVGNGVDLEVLPELPPAENERPALAFLGSVAQDWHGVDKILRLAELLPELDFHVVGYRAEDLDAAPPANVTVHGVLSREEYQRVLARSDAGIGTLALHRKEMEEASPLKVREYLGHGLPVLIAYEDTDLAGLDAWFLLRLPNEERNVDEHVDEIRAFVECVRGRRVPREAVEERVGWRAKERRRLEFLAQVAGSTPRGDLRTRPGRAPSTASESSRQAERRPATT
jgi:hypothetical protein